MWRRDTPVYHWMRKLHADGCIPVLRVELVCGLDTWPVEETRLIAEARLRGDRLLNVAHGGDEPYCSPVVRAMNGRSNAQKRVATAERAEIYRLKRYFGALLAKGEVSEANKEKLRYAARRAPHIFGCYAGV